MVWVLEVGVQSGVVHGSGLGGPGLRIEAEVFTVYA